MSSAVLCHCCTSCQSAVQLLADEGGDLLILPLKLGPISSIFCASSWLQLQQGAPQALLCFGRTEISRILEAFGLECAQCPLVGSEEIQIREPVLSLIQQQGRCPMGSTKTSDNPSCGQGNGGGPPTVLGYPWPRSWKLVPCLF